MNLQYLKAFYITVKLNSISKAAKELHLTQPGLSMQIQSLEKELEVMLLIRSNKGVELTEAGKVVFDYADTMLSMQHNIERDLENLKTSKKELIIGSCKAIGEYALPCSIYVYKQAHPEVYIDYDIANTEDVLKKLSDRTINLGIIQNFVEQKDIIMEKITSDKLLLVTSLPMLRSKITLKELCKLPLIFRETGSGARRTISECLSKYNIGLENLNIIYQLNSMEAIKSSIISGKGISFVPELTIKRELKDSVLREIEVENLNLQSDFYVAYRKGHLLTSYEKDFINFIKSGKRGFC
ncbi:LysR family transcriptional regulator [Alkalicella caledoniensis]|uniref:LysR family transcriptional regulator n=1 Tax=Alkalicella caledoniensis TaxID=2731377 RepID=A0A7G9W9K7_ALKCA|nr:LysR family transcriptional regulator [Alkalicella caledoniensis]QNO15369.1 LysR family transcriptional regulator [Alkalicella caledoniensis]